MEMGKSLYTAHHTTKLLHKTDQQIFPGCLGSPIFENLLVKKKCCKDPQTPGNHWKFLRF